MTLLDDLVPEPLQTWTPGVLDRLRAHGQIETLFFEFKSEWDGSEVGRTVRAFANRLGGFLLFGVTAKRPANTIDSFPGLKPADWLLEVTHNVVGHVSPLPIWDTVQIPSPDDPSRFVVVTRGEQSGRTPHIVTTSGRI